MTETPEIRDDGNSITLEYSAQFVDWELPFPSPLPAHVVGKNALGIEDHDEAKKAVIEAIQNKDDAALAPISSFWNSGFNFTELPDDTERYLASGPYVISDFVADQYITLTANPEYKGENAANIEEITIRFIPDPLAAVQALENGEVDVISPGDRFETSRPRWTASRDITVLTGLEGTYEHVDLVFANGGPFDPANYGGDADKALKVRQAFLKTVPRQEIVDTLIKPINRADAKSATRSAVVPGAPGLRRIHRHNGRPRTPRSTSRVPRHCSRRPGSPAGRRPLCTRQQPAAVQRVRADQGSAAQAGFNGDRLRRPTTGAGLLAPGAYDASLFGWQSTGLGVADCDGRRP